MGSSPDAATEKDIVYMAKSLPVHTGSELLHRYIFSVENRADPGLG